MELVKQFGTTSFAVTNPRSLLLCRVLDEVELSENTRVDHRALAVPFSQLHVSVPNQ